MAPIKMEENIKDKVEKRRIIPSNLAWEKLSAKLDKNEGKPSKKFFWWIGIAASIVGVFLVYNFFLNSNNSELIEPIIVDSPLEKPSENSNAMSNEIIVSNTESTTSEESEVNSKSKKSTVTNNKYVMETVKVANNQETLAQIDEAISKSEKTNESVLDEQQLQKLLKKELLVTDSVDSAESELTKLETETNSLLENAQNKVKNEKIIPKGNLSINAVSLLADVENDLEETFKDKFFNSIVSGYNTIRVAFAERIE